MKSFIIVSLTSLLIGVIALGSGAYNMAATEKHWFITEKIIEWVRNSSIESRAKDLQVPSLDDKDFLLAGVGHYAAMCIECHSAPGQELTELSQGLYPQAPIFYKQEPTADPEEKVVHIKTYFWVIKNGLKMTAMPAWGLSHDDETIWAMAIFVDKLKGMTTEQYDKLIVSGNGHGHHHNHNHNHGHE